MIKITFKYKDRYTRGNWNTQTCILRNIEECIDIYGLGKDCIYEILKVEVLKGEAYE